MAAYFVATLNDNGILAALDDPSIGHLVAVPLWRPGLPCTHRWQFVYEGYDGRPIMAKAVDNFRKTYGISQEIRTTRTSIPVAYRDIREIPSVDVALCTSASRWSLYRNWPYFPEFKERLEEAGMSYIDLTQRRVYDIPALNYVKKAGVYVGLETGTSHYVSSVVGRGLILQSGFSNFKYWCNYPYDYIELDLPCKNCFLSQGCQFAHQCMREITVEQVMNWVRSNLKRRRTLVHL